MSPLSNLPGPWRWVKRGNKWWRIHDELNIEDGPHDLAGDDHLHVRWYVVVNDLIGGYAVSHVNKPLSEQDPGKGEGELGDFLTEKIAGHIVYLHNNWLGDQ